MSHPKKLLNTHTVETAVVSCIDFRFNNFLHSAIEASFGVTEYDEIKLAGGAKNLSSPGKEERREVVAEDLLLAVEKHNVTKIILLTHENCGKYAADGNAFTPEEFEKEKAFHKKELSAAKDALTARFPGIETLLGFVYVTADDKVAIEKI